MQIPTNLLIVIAIVAGAGSVGLLAVDIFASLEAQGKSLCGIESHGGFRNGSNRFVCPPP
jgi:hypothetical protein